MSEPMALELVASNCMLLQHTLWYYGLPTWVRGGISIGDLYCGNSEIFGPALIDAYILEETVAKYPRIVMHESTYQAGIDNTDNRQDIIFVSRQPNELRMVETLKYFDYEPQRSKVLQSIRDTLQKEIYPIANIETQIENLLNDIQNNLYAKALNFREGNTRKADTWEEFNRILDEEGGFILAHWDGTPETEEAIKEKTKATIRCIPFDAPEEDGKCIFSGKPSKRRVVFARSY